MRAGDVLPGAVVVLSDGLYGVVLPAYGMRSGVAVDLWDAPAAILAADEEVEVVADELPADRGVGVGSRGLN